jgi:hypothetical protein
MTNLAEQPEEEQQERVFINPKGFKVPESEMFPQNILLDELVNKHIPNALELSKQMNEFKKKVFSDIDDYIALLAAEYNTELATGKGNLTLTSFDGRSQIVIGIDDDITFGPEIDIAKKLINEVVEEMISDSKFRLLREVVTDAFQTNKQGNYSKKGIYAMRKYRNSLDDPRWVEAMRALDEGIIAGSTKTYLRFYQKNEWGKKIQIPLSSTSVCMSYVMALDLYWVLFW